MTKKQAEDEIVTVITNIQKESGDEVPRLMPETVVIGGVPGFDSLRGLELTVVMTRYFDIPGENICVSEDGKRALTIGEIADRLMNETQKTQDQE